MIRVGVIGAESTGKSTLCKTLSKQYGYHYIEEYARTYVENLDRPYNLADLDTIAEHLIGQICADYNEQVVLFDTELDQQPDGLYIFDTELIIMKVWYEHVYGSVPEAVVQALKDYPMNLYLLLAPDIAADPDPVRENLDKREYFHAWYEREIQQTGVPYSVIRGQGEERTQTAVQAIHERLTND